MPSLRTLSFSSLGRLLLLLVLTSMLFSGEASMACHTGHAPSVSFYNFLQFPLPRLVKYFIVIFFWGGGGIMLFLPKSQYWKYIFFLSINIPSAWKVGGFQ